MREVYLLRYKHVSKAANPHYYSYDIGPVHVLGYSTEFYFYNETTTWGKQRLLDQLEFIKTDLAAANKNRQSVPWIITMGHRPMYCSNGNHGGACLTRDTIYRNGTLDGVDVGLEPIFVENKVDICLSGHEHSYERSFPVSDYKTVSTSDPSLFVHPKYPIHVITGAAGNRENLASFVDPKPDWSINRFDDYSVSLFKVKLNEISFFQLNHDAKVIDSFRVLKHKN